VRLHPIRSLVLSSDRAYRERALAVLAGLGPVSFATIALASCEDLPDVLALVRHERPEVVVLDASGCEAGVARVIVALAEASADVGVVVVCERSTAAARQLGALPKWGWTQDLRGAVEAAWMDRRPRAPEGIATAEAAGPAGPLAGWVEDVPPPSPSS
jgi:hypothetical protein